MTLTTWEYHHLTQDEYYQLTHLQRLMLTIDASEIAELRALVDNEKYSFQGDSVRIVLTDALIEQLKQGVRFAGFYGEAAAYIEYKPNDPT